MCVYYKLARHVLYKLYSISTSTIIIQNYDVFEPFAP